MRAIFPFVLLLAGCEGGLPSPSGGGDQQLLKKEITLREPAASEDICWAREESPAVMGKEMGDVLVVPEELAVDGTVKQPAIYRKEEVDVVVEPATPYWFRTLCPQVLDEAMVASVQRALQARDHYAGPITGKLDEATQDAIRSYQAAQGLDSEVLSLVAARQFGLVNYDPEALER